MMIPHHQRAIDMAEEALQRAEHPEIKDLARAIIASQTVEIAEMQGYLQTWYGETVDPHAADGMTGMMAR